MDDHPIVLPHHLLFIPIQKLYHFSSLTILPLVYLFKIYIKNLSPPVSPLNFFKDPSSPMSSNEPEFAIHYRQYFSFFLPHDVFILNPAHIPHSVIIVTLFHFPPNVHHEYLENFGPNKNPHSFAPVLKQLIFAERTYWHISCTFKMLTGNCPLVLAYALSFFFKPANLHILSLVKMLLSFKFY